MLLLSFIEGLTEFIPVSSTGHLVLTSHFMNLPETDFLKAFNVIIQFGAILAVVVLYWPEFRPNIELSTLLKYKKMIAGSLPALAVGFLLKDSVDRWLESPTIVALALIFGGLVMIIVDKHFARSPDHDVTLPQAIKIGFFQCWALIPGMSRSGSTIIGGQLLGLSRKRAAEFSFILAVPILTAASGYKLFKIRHSLQFENLQLLGLGTFFSFVFALLAIKTFIKLVQKYGFKWFGIYRILLGCAVLALIYFD